MCCGVDRRAGRPVRRETEHTRHRRDRLGVYVAQVQAAADTFRRMSPLGRVRGGWGSSSCAVGPRARWWTYADPPAASPPHRRRGRRAAADGGFRARPTRSDEHLGARWNRPDSAVDRGGGRPRACGGECVLAARWHRPSRHPRQPGSSTPSTGGAGWLLPIVLGKIRIAVAPARLAARGGHGIRAGERGWSPSRDRLGRESTPSSPTWSSLASSAWRATGPR